MGREISILQLIRELKSQPLLPLPEWNHIEVLDFSWGVVNISSAESSFVSDITDKLFVMNQVAMYTKGNVKEVGTIIAINTDGEGMRPLYKISIKGGQELEGESTYLSNPSHDQTKEAARKESATDVLANPAAGAIKLAEEAIVAANDKQQRRLHSNS